MLSHMIGTEKRKTTSSRSLSHNCQSSGTQLKFPSARFYYYFFKHLQNIPSLLNSARGDRSLFVLPSGNDRSRGRGSGSLPLIFRVEIASLRIHRIDLFSNHFFLDDRFPYFFFTTLATEGHSKIFWPIKPGRFFFFLSEDKCVHLGRVWALDLTRSFTSVLWTTYFDMDSQREGGGGMRASATIDHHTIEIYDRICPLVACLFVLLRSLLRNSLISKVSFSQHASLRASITWALDFFIFNAASTLHPRGALSGSIKKNLSASTSPHT